MTNDPRQQPNDLGADVTDDSPLLDIPDAGDDSQPLTTANPVDFATADINADAALVAGTLDDDDDRTLYEQALDSYEESDGGVPDSLPADDPSATSPHVQIYDTDA